MQSESNKGMISFSISLINLLNMKRILYYAAPMALLMASCSSDEPVPGVDEPTVCPVEEATLELNAAETAAAAQMQAFNMDFFKAMCAAEPTKNIVASPLSAQLLLSMVSNGCAEQTTAEIAAALGCEDLDAVNSLASKYLSYLPAADKAVTLNLANGVWYHRDYTLANTFAGTMNSAFMADVYKRDLQSGSKAMIDEINGWVNDKTKGLIPNIVDFISTNTTSLMASALYYNGQWTEPFDAKETKKGEFHGKAGSQTVDMMHKLGLQHYYAGDGFKAVKMDVGGKGAFEAVMVVPDEGIEIDALISGGKLDDCSAFDYTDSSIDYYLPKFKIEPTQQSLNGVLSAMGVSSLALPQKLTMFNENVEAWFDIYQKACIEFSEQGAEGAAVTWTFIATSNGEVVAPAIPVVKFDRPFAFFINETKTGACLFAARVNQL